MKEEDWFTYEKIVKRTSVTELTSLYLADLPGKKHLFGKSAMMFMPVKSKIHKFVR